MRRLHQRHFKLSTYYRFLDGNVSKQEGGGLREKLKKKRFPYQNRFLSLPFIALSVTLRTWVPVLLRFRPTIIRADSGLVHHLSARSQICQYLNQ